MHGPFLSSTWRAVCLAVVSSFLFVGCGDASSTSDEFRKYDKLTKTNHSSDDAGNDTTPDLTPLGDDVESAPAPIAQPDTGTEVAVADGGPVPDSGNGSDDPEDPFAKTTANDTATIGINPITGAPLIKAAVPIAGGVKLLVKSRKFKIEGPNGALRTSFDDFDLLKVLNMDPVTPDAPKLLPDWLKQLDGKKIRVRGFMYPSFLETGIERFVLARDNQICCFGRDPKIYDLVIVTLKNDVTTDYIQGRPFDVVGVFHIRSEIPEGGLAGLYTIDNAIVVDR